MVPLHLSKRKGNGNQWSSGKRERQIFYGLEAGFEAATGCLADTAAKGVDCLHHDGAVLILMSATRSKG
jgi:hypothetical protein